MLVTFRTILRRFATSRSLRASLRSQSGFTLIETLVAAVILVVGLIGLLGLIDISSKASATTRAREGATSLAREILEDARTIPYAQVIPTSIESQLQAMSAEGKYPLADGSSAAGWQIARRGFTYTVSVSECAIDNPKDGLATEPTHKEAKTFCSGQADWKAGTVDTEPEDLKRITTEVSWTVQKRTSTVKQVSTLTAAGQAIGLTARELQLVEPPSSYNKVPTEPVIAEAATKALTFSVSFPEGTTGIVWSLEGARQEERTPASKATSLTFSWTINESTKNIYVSDGTYQVSAQAVNSTGVIGPPISIPVRLIRGEPAAPKNLAGGLNKIYDNEVLTKVAELEWEADSERNVIGYRVLGPNKELICPETLETLSTATSCIDFGFSGKPPAEDSENAVTESSHVATVSITQAGSTAPNQPTNLVAEKNGSVTLKWKAPIGGEAASFYRIYRGSKNYTSRYGKTLSSECSAECSFTDTDTATTHEYWVTAARSNLVESEPLGPVTG
jgi:prepilin-type N-terminal cleavage/methylation domain-containing protein